ncbi:MAG: penicillin-binding protein activator [Sphingomonadaceae bacterium]|nr:penicillin-binding protein activator [Sphingomonadaceae bacterium]
MTERSGAMQQSAAAIRRVGFARTLAIAAASLLAACSTVVPKGPAAPPPPVVEAPRNQALPEDRERHRIALLVPLSGANGNVGQSLANAANLALLDTGGKGLRMTIYDTTNGGAAAAAQRAIAEGNGLILGPLLGPEVRAAAPVAARAHVPIVAFSNDLGAAGDDVYLLGYQPAQSIERVVQYAASRGMKRFGGLVPTGIYGDRASSAFLHAVNAAGGSVVAMQSYDRSPAGLAAAARKLGTGFDAVLVADNGRIAIQAAPSLKRGGSKLLGTELWNTEPSLAATPAMQGAWFAGVSDTLYGRFAAKYRTRFGKSPYRLASLGYDAVLLASRIAPDWRMGDAFPESRLRDHGGFSGVDGAFRFGHEGVAERGLEVYEIKPGGFVTISSAPASFDR